MSPQEAARLAGHATPRPWRAQKCPCGRPVCDSYTIEPVQGAGNMFYGADAALIVRAVNSHDALVEALQLIATAAPAISTANMQVIARRALRAAGVEP